MAPSIFSRKHPRTAEKDQQVPEPTDTGERPREGEPDQPLTVSVDEDTELQAPLAQSWTYRSGASAWADSLLSSLASEADALAEHRIELVDVHPGGISQLYVDHPTRLDSLVREPSALKRARAEIDRLRQDARQLAGSHGHADVHLAIGSASWQGLEGAPVPVLMRRVELERDEDGELTVQLLAGVEMNSRLLYQIAQAGTAVDTVALAQALQGDDGFLPRRAFEVLRAAASGVPGFELRDTTTLGIFTHPATRLHHELQDISQFSQNSVVRALAGDAEAEAELSREQPQRNPDDRDPWHELGLGDQTPETQDVLEWVGAGASGVVDIRGEQAQAQAIASIAAALVANSRRVLVVLGDASLREQLFASLAAADAEEIAADLSSQDSRERVATHLLAVAQGQDGGGSADEEEIHSIRTALGKSREALAQYTEALHEEFDPWGMSPFDALQVLTDLTSLPDAPKTTVRLPMSVLTGLAVDGGERAGRLLERASELGLFTGPAAASAWQGVTIEESSQVGSLLGALGRLVGDLLPAVRVQMSTTAARVELLPAVTLNQWASQLRLFDRVRKILDTFKPEILERSPADMVVATASKQWRAARNINLKGTALRHLVREAKDLVRPGVHVEDLHHRLIEAQTVRQQWQKARTGDSWPLVPDHLDELNSTLEQLNAELDVVRPALEPVYGDFGSMPIEELSSILDTLFHDPEGARRIPDLLAVLDELDLVGLRDLVLDLRERSVDGDVLSLELDLAWWASALGFMLAQEPRLGGFEPAVLQDLLTSSRELDQLHVEQLGRALTSKVRTRANEAMAMYPEQREQLTSELEVGGDVAGVYSSINLAWDIAPIVVAGPSQVPALVRAGRAIDSVVIAGVDSLPPEELIPALERGRQVIAVGESTDDLDSMIGRLAQVLPVVQMPVVRVVNSHLLGDIVSRRLGAGGNLSVPSPRPGVSAQFVHVDGRGMPAPGVHAIESSAAEVDKVVELVERYLEEDGERSLAVVTLSERHADRVLATLKRRVSDDAKFAELMRGAGSPESLVLTAQQLAETRPDRVILSIGFAKTPHGRVIHDFGVLSSAESSRVVRDLAAGVRGDLTVVSAINYDDIDPARMRSAGEQVLLDLLAASHMGIESAAGDQRDEEDTAPPQLLIDLAERLHRLGLTVVPNLGTTGGVRIPLAVGHPEVPDELLVAVLTDDENYVSQPSQRIRSRHWPTLLEEQGWKVHTTLSMGVFIDPNREAQEIVRLALDAVDEYYARMGLPHTPAAAAALGIAPVGTDEPESAEENSQAAPEGSGTGAITEVDVTGVFGAVAAADSSRAAVAQAQEAIRELGDKQVRERTPRPLFAVGLPLAAYSDDQLDEVAAWIASDDVPREEDQMVEELRDILGITRRGAQTDAVLRNVARRIREA